MSAGQYLASRLDGVIHEPTQVHPSGVDLTVSGIYRIDTPGRIDFGGDELEDPDLTACETELRNPDDEYEWWTLESGQYLLQYNETLTGDEPVVLQPRDAARKRGLSHPGVRTRTLDPMPIGVVDGGVRIKENARVSTIRSP